MANTFLQDVTRRLSQKGRISAVKGRMRPIMALICIAGKTGHRDQGAHRIPHRAERHRRGIRDQAQHGRGERLKAQPDHHGAANGYRRAAAARAFQNRSEGERDQQGLQTAVFGDAADRLLDDFETARIPR